MCTSCTDTVPFFPYEWVDDPIMVEPDLPDRCRTAEDALRLAMLAVLGPTSINEEKFTSWSTTTIALGLEWDTVAGTVSIPVEKIDKALARVRTLEDQRRVSKHELECLLGSLRHVASCLHAARPFYQRLHKLARCAPRFGRVLIKEDVRDDLRWFSNILKHGTLRGVRTRLFDSRLPQPDVHYYMDASNYAACMLDPARKLFMIIIFDEDERKLMTVKDATTTFDINVREQLCIAIAAMVFSPTWARLLSPRWPHIRCWTDNHTAMPRTNSLGSNNRFAQQLNRCISLAKAPYRFRISAAHLPGIYNLLADTGSRRNDISYRKVFTNGVSGWTQVPVPSSLRYIYKDYSAIFKPRHWPGVPESRTSGRGVNGAHGEPAEASNLNCHDLGHLDLIIFAIKCWSGSVGTVPNTASTVFSKISHISWHHLRRYGYTVQLEPNHVLAVRGMQRLSAAPRRKSPVTPAILRTLRDRLAFDKPHDRAIWGVTVMVFFFLLRRSEYLAVDGKLSEFAVQRRDVTFADGKGNATASKQATQSVTLRIRGSKTDQLRESTRRTLHRSGSAWLCAVRAVWALVHESKKANFPDDPLCKVRDGSCVSALIVTRQLKLAAIRAGYDSKDFGTHTRRSGGATALYTGGSSDTTVKLHGWWKSECYQRYVHRPPPNWPRLCSTASGTLRNRRRLFKGVLQCMEPANNSDSPLDVECGPPFTNRNCI